MVRDTWCGLVVSLIHKDEKGVPGRRAVVSWGLDAMYLPGFHEFRFARPRFIAVLIFH